MSGFHNVICTPVYVDVWVSVFHNMTWLHSRSNKGYIRSAKTPYYHMYTVYGCVWAYEINNVTCTHVYVGVWANGTHTLQGITP